MKFQEIVRLPGMILFFVLMIPGFILLFVFDKGDILLTINAFHTAFLDLLFKYWTYFGDGWVFLPLFIFFLLRSYYFALVTALSVITQTLLVQGMKKILFDEVVRPKLFFENFQELHSVVGVDIHSYHAFPSGHTASAFSVAMILSLYSKNRNLSFLFFMGAFLTGLSRIYLLQHFYIDVYFGASIGVLSVLISYFFLEKTGLENRNPWKGALLKRG